MTTPRSVAIVTGASSGIGRATAIRLADSGWLVVIVARRASHLTALKEQIKTRGGAAVAVVADLGKLRDIENVVSQAQVAGGRIDALLNIAGIGGMNQVMTPDDDVQRMIATNLLAPIRLMRAVIPIMQAQGAGTIVNVGSVKGEVAIGGIYSATKFGLRGLTDSVRREVAGSGIRVSLVEPGYIATEMTGHRTSRMPGPDIVVDAIESCLTRSRRTVVVPGRYRLVIWASILFPRLVDRRYNGRITSHT
ncbi:MAG TPA: SDR family NAD(P)-dependent oxidoreductase [Galbitalea sp.]|jgi:NAD(P)-dependent dehydrogenase (short-subunit alcohol dehydrogenase family)|nr:SDR family NAD(P)-dependent oxidoreductase [Galbitalea sp.]